MSADLRQHERISINTHGQILLDSGFKISFRVVDMSRRGARIQIERHVILPQNFTVEINSPDGQRIKRCEAERRWQVRTLAGVKFMNSETIQIS